MPISSKLKNYLDKEGVEYEHMEHARAYTATEVAAAQHVPGAEMIKGVLVKSNGEFMMCVLPATHNIDLDKLKKVIEQDSVEIASEDDVRILFPDEETGAEPPLGNLYNLTTIVEKSIEGNDSVVFNAGTHTDTVKMKAADYLRVANPKAGEFGKHI